MATASQLVSWAQSQIGVKEVPANSNKVIYWDDYRKYCGVNYQGSPWCAAFVAVGMAKIGQWSFTKDEGRFRYCPSLVNWAKQNGQWLDRSATPQPGDLVLFADRGTACHVGIVEKRISSSQIQTIEGNTSVTSNDNGGAVMRRTRSYGAIGSTWYVLGFVRSKWSSSSSGGSTSSSTSLKLYMQGEETNGHVMPSVCNNNDNVGNGTPIAYISIWANKGVVEAQAHTKKGWWPVLSNPSVISNHKNGAIGDGTAIDGLRFKYNHDGKKIRYRVMTKKGWHPWVENLKDLGGSKDDFAGNLKDPILRVEAKLV